MMVFIYSVLVNICIQAYLLTIAIAQVDVHSLSPGRSAVWTPEAVLITLGFGAITILLGMVAWLGKKQLDTILTTMEMFASKQAQCRENLSGRFADKYSTTADIKELYARTDRHESCLQRHSVMIGGRRVEDKEFFKELKD